MGQNVSVSEQREFDAHQRIPLCVCGRIINNTGIRMNMLSCLQITSFFTEG